ncbi:MAG: MFS transporter [Microthrixaceae bacterium]
MVERRIGSIDYAWLLGAQVISAFGDWVGLFAMFSLATAVGGSTAAANAGPAMVLLARVAPTAVLGPPLGVLVDRYRRVNLMRVADFSRAILFCLLPFVGTYWTLIGTSVLLEVFTLIWSPAKEAMVPSLVPRERLTTANSLGILAAYGTMPIASAAQYGLKQANERLADVEWLSWMGFAGHRGSPQALAFYVDALSFVGTILIVTHIARRRSAIEGAPTAGPARIARRPATAPRNARVAPPATDPVPPEGPRPRRGIVEETKEGWRFIVTNRAVRAVTVGLGAGLLGGAMVVPLGPAFAKDVLGDADAFSLFITALGLGVAGGVLLQTAVQRRINRERTFVVSLYLAGAGLAYAATMASFWLCALGVFVLGLGAGSVYVLGYTLIGEHTDDELRGRTFTSFLSLVRMCVLGALLLGPTVDAVLEPVLRRIVVARHRGLPAVSIGGWDYPIPSVRVTLWLGSGLIVLAATLAARSIGMRRPRRSQRLHGEPA